MAFSVNSWRYIRLSAHGSWPKGAGPAPGSLDRRCFMLIVSPKRVVGWRGGNQNVEGDLLTFGYLMLDDSLGYPYFRLFNVGRFPWIPLLSAN